MKRLFLLIFTVLTGVSLLAGAVKGPRLEFVTPVIDLGTIFTDKVELITLKIEFKNTGDQPLLVSTSRGCCGTRIVDWTREPINPGEKGIVEIQIRPAPHPHTISRIVTIESNDTEGPKTARITGKVEAPPSVL